MEPDEYLIWLYLKVEDIFTEIVGDTRLRARGFAPSLSDIEVITIELFAEYQGHGNDKSIWRYMKQHWQSWFPALRSYKNFTKHCANLMIVKEKILTQLSTPKESDNFYIIDGVPLQICKFARANSSKIFAGEASFGYCAAKKETFFGFKGHLVITDDGQIRGFNLTSAPCDERAALLDMNIKIQGHMLGDKGYIGETFTQEMKARNITMHTPLRRNMKEMRPKSFVKSMMNKRRYVETVLSKLVEQFSLVDHKARDLWRLSNKIYRKLISYSFALQYHGSTKFLES